MKTSIFQQITLKSIFNYSFPVLLFMLLFNSVVYSQNHCLVIKNVGINMPGGTQNPDCDGTFLNGCKPSEFIELFNTCDTSQNFSCYIVCSGDWCVRIPTNFPDLPPSGTIVLGSTFSPGFDANNPFHIDIHNCNNCSWNSTGNGGLFQNIGILANSGGQVTLYNSVGDLEMGVYWGNSSDTYGSINPQFSDGCLNQNISLQYPDPNGNPEFVDLGTLAETDACAISIGCATITDNSVSAGLPVALCDADGEDFSIGGSNLFTEIGPINTGTACFYEANTETFIAYYQPQNFSSPPWVTWSSSTGLMFKSFNGDTVSSITTPVPNVIFTSAGNHSITMALQLPGDNCIYYHTEEFFVDVTADFSDLMVCIGSDFTIEDAPPGNVLFGLAVVDPYGDIVTPPQFTLPATFNIPGPLLPGTYTVRYILEDPQCTVDVPLEVLPAGQCPQNCDDVAIIGLPQSVTTQSYLPLNASPPGGTFSGEGVIFNAFNPSLLSPGLYQITYTYTNDEGCTSSVSENILVIAITVNFISYNLGTITPYLVIDIDVFAEGVHPITITDLNRWTLFSNTSLLRKGNQKLRIDATGWQRGVYFMKIGEFSKPEKIYVF